MEYEFKRMTDDEIRNYVFKPTPDFFIIKAISLQYIEFYKLVGEDASAVKRFAMGNARSMMTVPDAPSQNQASATMVISPGKSSGNNIVSMVDSAMLEALKRDIKAALKERDANDLRRSVFEKRNLRYNKKLNREERREEKKEEKYQLRREKFNRKYGYYPEDFDEETEQNAPDDSDISDKFDKLYEIPEQAEQDGEEAARLAMYEQLEQILEQKEQPAQSQSAPLKPQTENTPAPLPEKANAEKSRTKAETQDNMPQEMPQQDKPIKKIKYDMQTLEEYFANENKEQEK